jgi:hypothetical protein
MGQMPNTGLSLQTLQSLQLMPQPPQLPGCVMSVSHGVLHVPKPGGQVVVPPPHVPSVQVGALAGQSVSEQHAKHPLIPEHTIVPAPQVLDVEHKPASLQVAPAVEQAPPPHDCEQPVEGSFAPSAVHVAPHKWKPVAHMEQLGPVVPGGHEASVPIIIPESIPPDPESLLPPASPEPPLSSPADASLGTDASVPGVVIASPIDTVPS